ncbi:MAG: ABC transporter substrate-binding protein [Pyramidobacter sp.]|jgi:iron(III) transport system substrate-binding protein
MTKNKGLLWVVIGVVVFSIASYFWTAGKSAGSSELTLYTSQPEADVQKLIAAFNADHPNVKVSVFRSGTEEVVSKVLAEEAAKTVKADVLLVADNVTFELLKQKNMLESYRSPETKGIPTQFIDPDGTYTGTKIITTGIIVNTSRIKQMPTSFADLTKAPYTGDMAMPSPLYSGAAAYNLGVLTRTQGIGWEWYQALKDNGMMVGQGNGSVQKLVVSGEKACGLVADYMANRSRMSGAPVEFVYPSEGSPVITEPIGLLKASAQKEAAKLFIDFVLSKKGQELAAAMGYTPIKEGISAPEGLKNITQFKAIAVPSSELFSHREEDKKQFTALFQN